jgi:hypothetical protein
MREAKQMGYVLLCQLRAVHTHTDNLTRASNIKLNVSWRRKQNILRNNGTNLPNYTASIPFIYRSKNLKISQPECSLLQSYEPANGSNSEPAEYNPRLDIGFYHSDGY